ncbi:ABC transporter permease [Psychromonas sp. SR45-3]|uniref:ABC transporter permease n=1 Tax=Psychromonas sp. SR45-3 TaxID=2760930 RepID=UPI0015FAAC5E|nr:ABC transporter permease [Psychromonas sp. SR45-3]MBB1271352.1 ABC transporter permease [Psychromonas sp. SR45-3]
MKKINIHFWGVVPAYVIMMFLMIIPLFIILYVSFMTSDPYGGYKSIYSLDSYIQILYSYDWDENLVLNFHYLQIIGRTIVLSFLAATLCLIISFPVAFYISKQNSQVKQLLLYLVTIPFWVSMVVRVYAWVLILSDGGVLETGLKFFGFVNDIDSLLYSNNAMLVGMVYTYIPLMILPIYASIEKLDKRLLEAANDLYSSRIMSFKKIIFPLCKPGIIAGFVLVFVPCLGAVLEPTLLGGGKTMMMGNLIQNQFGVSRNWSFGASLTILLLSITLLFMLFQAYRSSKLSHQGIQ